MRAARQGAAAPAEKRARGRGGKGALFQVDMTSVGGLAPSTPPASSVRVSVSGGNSIASTRSPAFRSALSGAGAETRAIETIEPGDFVLAAAPDSAERNAGERVEA
ncbi:hypothetical protein EON77_07305, partial [bacterium]